MHVSFSILFQVLKQSSLERSASMWLNICALLFFPATWFPLIVNLGSYQFVNCQWNHCHAVWFVLITVTGTTACSACSSPVFLREPSSQTSAPSRLHNPNWDSFGLISHVPCHILFPGQRARPIKTWMNIAAVSGLTSHEILWIKNGMLLKFICVWWQASENA